MAKMYKDDESSFADHMKYQIFLMQRIPVFLDCLEKQMVEVNKQRKEDNIVFVDYGTCDGGNILPVFNKFSDFIRQKGYRRHLKLVFNDKDERVSRMVEEKLKGFKFTNDVEIDTIVANCYSQFLPKESVDVAFCIMVVQFLSSPGDLNCCQDNLPFLKREWETILEDLHPSIVKQGIMCSDADNDEMKEIQCKADNDWLTFLKHRSAEMKPGGFLLTIFPCDGKETRHLDTVMAAMFRELFYENEVTEDERESILFDVYYKSESEIRKPFETRQINSLVLTNIHFRNVLFEEIGFTIDTVADFFKVLLYNTIYDGLSKQRTKKEKEDILKLFLAKVTKSYQEHASKFSELGFSLVECIIHKVK